MIVKTLSIGTQGVTAYDISWILFTIKKGTRVTITGIDTSSPSLGYELTDIHGNRVVETGFDSIIPDSNN